MVRPLAALERGGGFVVFMGHGGASEVAGPCGMLPYC